MLPLALLVLLRSSAPTACTTSADCSLLGDCATSRKCVCDPGWTSANCSVLDLAPARWGNERQAYETNTSSWGGNAILDPTTKLYHLFFSEMRTGGLHSYSQEGHCQLTTAVSASPLGPFTRHRQVLRSSATGPISHNVQPFLGGDGAVYIFFITGHPKPGGDLSTGAAGSGVPPGGPLSVMIGRAAVTTDKHPLHTLISRDISERLLVFSRSSARCLSLSRQYCWTQMAHRS